LNISVGQINTRDNLGVLKGFLLQTRFLICIVNVCLVSVLSLSTEMDDDAQVTDKMAAIPLAQKTIQGCFFFFFFFFFFSENYPPPNSFYPP
jgi:hypothetical protein